MTNKVLYCLILISFYLIFAISYFILQQSWYLNRHINYEDRQNKHFETVSNLINQNKNLKLKEPNKNNLKL